MILKLYFNFATAPTTTLSPCNEQTTPQVRIGCAFSHPSVGACHFMYNCYNVKVKYYQ